jgi:hypothetical protein
MTKTVISSVLFAFAFGSVAQEPSPSQPQPSATEVISATAAPASAATATPAATATAAPSASAPATTVRSVRISFLPPPLEGTISLGIYDKSKKLVRVLHREAAFEEFSVGADALITKWDGKDDDGQDLPAGKYRARGYVVGPLKIEYLGSDSSPPTSSPTGNQVSIKLVANPLLKEEQTTLALAVGFDDQTSFLKTADNLPLYTITKRPDLRQISIAKIDDKTVDIFEDDGSTIEHWRVSKLNQMMAFDCGEIELK